MSRLQAERVEIESIFKAFGLDRGSSEGSTVRIVFSAPPDYDRSRLKRDILAEKRQLDILVLTMEYLRGAVQASDYEVRKKVINESYDQLLRGANATADTVSA